MALSSIQGITIPKKGKSSESFLKDIRDAVYDGVKLNPEEQEWFDREKKRIQFKREEERIANLQLKYNSPQIYKIRNKLSKTYDKYLANGAWFKASLKMFSNMGKKAGSWLMDILKFIFLLAIFDPKGKFLRSIVNFLLKIVIWLIDIIVEYLPMIINTMIYLITEVIPPLLHKVVDALAKALSEGFHKWADKLPEGSTLKKIFNWLGDAFGKEGILTKFFEKLADNFPAILIGLGALAIFGKIAPVLKILPLIFSALGWVLGTLLPGIFSFISLILWPLITGILSVLWTGLMGLLTTVIFPLLSVIAAIAIAFWPLLAIAAIVGVFVLLWKYAEKISDFFDGLIERFKKMSIGMKILTVVIAILLFPITAIIAAIYGIVKLFKWIKGGGISSAWKSTKGFFSKVGSDTIAYYKNAWIKTKGFFSKTADDTVAYYKNAWQKTKQFFSDTKDTYRDANIKTTKSLFNIGTKIKGFFSWLGDTVKTKVSTAVKQFKAIFATIKKIGVMNIFKSLGKSITTMAKGAKDWVSSKISSMASAASNAVTERVSSAVDWTLNIGTKIKNAIVDAWGFIKNSFSRWFESLQYQFYQFIGLAKNKFWKDKNEEIATVAFYRSKGLSEPEAFQEFQKIERDRDAFYRMVAEKTNTPIADLRSGSEQIIKAIDALRNSGQKVVIDKRNAFALTVTNVR